MTRIQTLFVSRFYQVSNFASTGGLQKTKAAIQLFLLFALIYAPGYMFFFNSVGFVNDDFSAFRYIAGEDGLKGAISPLVNWLQGRPLGHSLLRLQHYLFKPFPPGVFQLWCGALIIFQSIALYRIFRNLLIAKAPAVVGASALGLAPFAQSIYLPIHAGLTEFSTLLFFVGVLFAFANKPLRAALCVTVSLLFYEHMLPLMWAPVLIFLWKAWEKAPNANSFLSLRNNTETLKYIFSFGVLFVGIFVVRDLMDAGREASVSGFSIMELLDRMRHAGVVGARTSSRILRGAQRYNEAVGAGTLYIAFWGSVVAVAAVLIAYRRDMLSSRQSSVRLMIFLFVLGLFIIWLSHVIYVTPNRYPPAAVIGRRTNMHSGARIGLALSIAAAGHVLFTTRLLGARASGLVAAVMTLSWMTQYSHSYGAASARVWDKKVQLARAHAFACSAASSFRNSIIILPNGFLKTKSDAVVDWTTHLTPIVFFDDPQRTRLFVVVAEKQEEFFSRFSNEEKTVDLNSLTGSGYAWVVGKNPKNLVVRKDQSVVVELSSGGQLNLFSAPTKSNDSETCPFSARRRFKSLNLFATQHVSPEF